MQRIIIRTKTKVHFRDVTPEVQKAVQSSGVENGVCHIFVPHTTAGITLNEHADPSVMDDVRERLEALVPENIHYQHAEGNSPAHVKSSMMGSSATVFIENSRLVLGTWQGIFLCEFDGPRDRTVMIKLIPDRG